MRNVRKRQIDEGIIHISSSHCHFGRVLVVLLCKYNFILHCKVFETISTLKRGNGQNLNWIFFTDVC